MKTILSRLMFILTLSHSHVLTFCQDVGIGLANPTAKLHIKGSADASQLIIDGNTTQSNTNPFIKLRKSSGIDLLWIHSDDSTNAFLGFKSGRVNVVGPQGINNTFIGSRTGYSNTNGRDNTAVGTNALFSNSKASFNTAIGTNALYTQSFSPVGGAWWQSNNVAIGYDALYSNQPTNAANGVNNTAIGSSALRSNTIGAQNIATGGYALYLNTTGSDNTAVGYSALNANTTGNDNIAIGRNALASNLNLSENIAIGNDALFLQQTAPENWQGPNIAIGHGALYANYPSTYYQGANNTAIGNYTLTSNSTGSANTAYGHHALHDNGGGSYNTAIGYKAMYESNANFNTALGYETLSMNASGERNTAIGHRALLNNSGGDQNTSIGADSQFSTSTGSDNTSVGYQALNNNHMGNNNVAVGAGSGTADYADDVNNTVSIGNHGWLNGYQNQAFIGNASTAWIGGWADWHIYSDARIKNDVREDVKGLEFINRLRPVTYFRSINAAREISGDDETKDYPGKYDAEQIRLTGFLAQEVEMAANESNYDFSGVRPPRNAYDLYSLTYAEFVVPLVKAAQELSDKNNAQDQMIEQLRSENESLIRRIEKLEELLLAKN